MLVERSNPELEISTQRRLSVFASRPVRIMSSAAAQSAPGISWLPILLRKPPIPGVFWLLYAVEIHCAVRATLAMRTSSRTPSSRLPPVQVAPIARESLLSKMVPVGLSVYVPLSLPLM